jgi:acylphosphatase
MSDRIGRRYLISGRVQGVGFRYFAERSARQWGISGWVRNLADGRVEVHASGERGRMEGFEALMREGPSHAVVREFESMEDVASGSGGFEIR